MSTSTRNNILFAADSVIREKGIQRLTLDEVAKVAGVSKGGLLYHFASKDALIQGMLETALESFDAEIQRLRELDTSPGAWLRAYIRASFPNGQGDPLAQTLIGSAVLASVGSNPAITLAYQQHVQKWIRAAATDGIEQHKADAIRLAVDGIWLQEALGIAPFAAKDRVKVIKGLIRMTQSES